LTFAGQHPTFQRRNWFQGREIHGSGVDDIGWFNIDGTEVSDEDWHEAEAKAIGVFFNGEEIPGTDRQGQRIIDDSFLIFFNAQAEAQTFVLPPELSDRTWQLVLDTKLTDGFVESAPEVVGKSLVVGGRSLIVLMHPHSHP
jgi:isoamylase